MTLAKIAEQYQDKLLDKYDKEEAQSIFMLVVYELLGYSKSEYLLQKNEEISDEIQLKFKKVLNDISIGKPVQYILGSTEFYGLSFSVNPSVLIPRPETEELVDWILNEVPVDANLNLLDVGTGSGCIAIALKKNLAQAKVSAVDISAEALATAKLNAELNAVSVEFILADILQPKENILQRNFDVIVSNPPYIKEDEKPTMHENVLQHEPHGALFVSNERPLIFYEAIADFALETLNPGGKLFFEINEFLGNETVEMLKFKSFADIVLRKDMQGKDRMVLAHKI
jgi:release factor glutamine methyltransferase